MVRISACGPARRSLRPLMSLCEPFKYASKSDASWWRTLFEAPDADAPWKRTVEGPANIRLRQAAEPAWPLRGRGHGAATDGVAAHPFVSALVFCLLCLSVCCLLCLRSARLCSFRVWFG